MLAHYRKRFLKISSIWGTSLWLRSHRTVECFLVKWSRDVTHVETDACRCLACPRGTQFVNKHHKKRAGAPFPGVHPSQPP